jgi:hypothetical protein
MTRFVRALWFAIGLVLLQSEISSVPPSTAFGVFYTLTSLDGWFWCLEAFESLQMQRRLTEARVRYQLSYVERVCFYAFIQMLVVLSEWLLWITLPWKLTLTVAALDVVQRNFRTSIQKYVTRLKKAAEEALRLFAVHLLNQVLCMACEHCLSVCPPQGFSEVLYQVVQDGLEHELKPIGLQLSQALLLSFLRYPYHLQSPKESSALRMWKLDPYSMAYAVTRKWLRIEKIEHIPGDKSPDILKMQEKLVLLLSNEEWHEFCQTSNLCRLIEILRSPRPHLESKVIQKVKLFGQRVKALLNTCASLHIVNTFVPTSRGKQKLMILCFFGIKMFLTRKRSTLQRYPYLFACLVALAIQQCVWPGTPLLWLLLLNFPTFVLLLFTSSQLQRFYNLFRIGVRATLWKESNLLVWAFALTLWILSVPHLSLQMRLVLFPHLIRAVILFRLLEIAKNKLLPSVPLATVEISSTSQSFAPVPAIALQNQVREILLDTAHEHRYELSDTASELKDGTEGFTDIRCHPLPACPRSITLNGTIIDSTYL